MPPEHRTVAEPRSGRSGHASATFLDVAAPILAAAFGFATVAAVARINITYWDGAGWRQPLGALRLCFWDIVLVGILAVIASGLAYIVRDRRRPRRAVQAAFVAVTFVLSVFACINVRAFELLGYPLTYSWVSFAGDFESRTAREAIGSAADLHFWLLLSALLIVHLLVFVISLSTLRQLSRGRFAGAVLPCVLAGTGLVLLGSVHPWTLPEKDRVYSTNPAVELVRTALWDRSADLLLMRNAIPPDRLPPQVNDPANLPEDLRHAAIRNVVVIVLESVGAKHVAGSDEPPGFSVTPRLAGYLPEALRFTTAYAHAGQTTKSLFALVTGRYPFFGYVPEPQIYRNSKLTTLPRLLKAKGFRTALFADLQYQDVGAFLKGRGFDVLADTGDLKCSGQSRDACITNAAAKWIASGPSPFYAVVWTHDTHLPYSPPGKEASADPSDLHDQNRYLAALRGSDAAIGNLLDWLKRRGLLRTTLVIVVGDHGEAFGEHGTYFHSGSLFEEELHIPMLLINDSIHGRRNDELVATEDVPQTILHVLKMPAERSWDGRSVFDPNGRKRLFLFAPSSSSVGFREGDRKYIYDLMSGETSLFDLKRDPGEMHNLADNHTTAYVQRHFAGWVQEQNRRVAATLR